MCVGNSGGQGDASSAHGFGSIVVGNEGSVIEVGVNARMNSRLDEPTPGLSIPNPPSCAFIGQLLFASGEVHILHSYFSKAVSVRRHPFVVNRV